MSAWLGRSRHADSVSVAVCGRSMRSPVRAGTCRFVSGRKSRSSKPRAGEFARSLETSAVTRELSPVNYGATRLLESGGVTIGHQSPVESRHGRASAESGEAGCQPAVAHYVQERLSGEISASRGTAIAGPATGKWTGRNKPHRKDRAWVQAWSPEQIANHQACVFGPVALCVCRGRVHGARPGRTSRLKRPLVGGAGMAASTT